MVPASFTGGVSSRNLSDMNTKIIGDFGEDYVCSYIREQGMRVLARNFRFGREEIDIIAEDKGAIVFIEVKARSGVLYGLPAEAVNKTKQRSIIRAAVGYLKINKLTDRRVRFDVASVLDNELKYIKSAFDTTGMLR